MCQNTLSSVAREDMQRESFEKHSLALFNIQHMFFVILKLLGNGEFRYLKLLFYPILF